MKKVFKFIGAIFVGFFIGCAIAVIYSLIMQVVEENKGDEIVRDDINGNIAMTYNQIAQADAKNIMDTESDFVILDVRTEEEFFVYCRSGNRSKNASEVLVD